MQKGIYDKKGVCGNNVCNTCILIISCLTLSFLGAICGISTSHVSAATYTLSFSTTSPQSINVSSAGTGTSISEDNISVATNCRAGYNLTLSTSVNDNNLYLNGNSSNNTAGTYFIPSDGTTDLATADNTWGYYLPASGGSAPTSSSVFNAVPVLGSPVALKTPAQTASATDISDNFSVYYGVSVSSDLASGNYKMIKDTNNVDGTLFYYATLAESCISYTVTFNPTSTAGGTSVSGTGTMSSQTIYEGIATPLNTNTYTAPSGYTFLEWNTAQDGTGTSYTDGQSVTDLTTPGQSITLYAQWEEPCPGGKICYKANGSNVEGTMGRQNVGSSATSITLLATNFSRSGYGFAGWSEDKDAISHKTTAKVYGPQEDLTFTAGQYQNEGLTLYAVWVPSEGYLQDSTKLATLCGTGTGSLTQAPTNGTANLTSVAALTDQRDNDTYAIAKLADGKCWMIENLRLESTNSDNSTGTLAQGYGTSTTYGNFSGLATAETANFSYSTTANSLYYSGTQSGDATVDIGTTNYPGYRMPRYNNTNTQNRAQNNPNSNSGSMYSYGNYYTWHAAIADLTYNGTSNQSTTGTSLCPSGWHLPTGGLAYASGNTGGVNVTGNPSTFREFYNLGYTIMGSNLTAYESNANNGTSYYGTNTINTAGDTATKAFRKYPNNFIYSGYINGSSAQYRGSYGSYWSSTAYSDLYAHYLFLNSSSVYPGTSDNLKSYGRSIRCLSPS